MTFNQSCDLLNSLKVVPITHEDIMLSTSWRSSQPCCDCNEGEVLQVIQAVQVGLAAVETLRGSCSRQTWHNTETIHTQATSIYSRYKLLAKAALS